jgi:hypothetical protein
MYLSHTLTTSLSYTHACVCSLSVAIIFIGYAIQTHYRPFMDQLDLDIAADSVDHVRVDGAVLNYVRRLTLFYNVVIANIL